MKTMSNIQELLDCDDLRYNSRVIRAAIEFGIKIHRHQGEVEFIEGSLADIAFEMQLHVRKGAFETELLKIYKQVAINDVSFVTYGIFVGPRQRIIAAVLTFEIT